MEEYSEEELARYFMFVKELESLSKKYGVTIKSTGDVRLWEDGRIEKIVYTKDISSSDLQISDFQTKW